jgi:hypothetical protein
LRPKNHLNSKFTSKRFAKKQISSKTLNPKKFETIMFFKLTLFLDSKSATCEIFEVEYGFYHQYEISER